MWQASPAAFIHSSPASHELPFTLAFTTHFNFFFKHCIKKRKKMHWQFHHNSIPTHLLKAATVKPHRLFYNILWKKSYIGTGFIREPTKRRCYILFCILSPYFPSTFYRFCKSFLVAVKSECFNYIFAQTELHSLLLEPPFTLILCSLKLNAAEIKLFRFG